MKIFLSVLLSLTALSAPAQTDDAKEVRGLIERSASAVLDVLKDKASDRETRKRKIGEIADPLFDFPLMAKLTLGRKHWPGLTPAQQKEFTDLFVKTLQDSYFDKVDLLSDETVEFEDPAPTEKGKYQMLVYVLSKSERHKMLYKLYKKGPIWKVYDVEIEGISLIKSYGSQYDQFLQNGSVSDLLKKLREKSLEQPGELKATEEEIKKSTSVPSAPEGHE
ncbi:MAG: ABC transporter substrate-binding protein [Elusimicrobia bacterium]|nr:ABC transporter substrate-binding protein [Elusimicrobiota bacterium]